MKGKWRYNRKSNSSLNCKHKSSNQMQKALHWLKQSQLSTTKKIKILLVLSWLSFKYTFHQLKACCNSNSRWIWAVAIKAVWITFWNIKSNTCSCGPPQLRLILQRPLWLTQRPCKGGRGGRGRLGCRSPLGGALMPRAAARDPWAVCARCSMLDSTSRATTGTISSTMMKYCVSVRPNHSCFTAWLCLQGRRYHCVMWTKELLLEPVATSEFNGQSAVTRASGRLKRGS